MPWSWTKQKEKAAVMVAEDHFTDQKIADKIGISRRTLENWKKVDEFTERVAEHVEVFREVAITEAMADKRERVRVRQDLLRRFRELIKQRSATYGDDPDVPGGETGLLVRTLKKIGSGEDAEVVEEWRADTAVSAEIRALMVEIAMEFGQWKTKTDITSGEQPIKALIGVDLDRI